MSVNRENVTWQAKDGTWSIGFFDFYATGDPMSEDWDFEWDVEYDFSKFNWTSHGHPTEEAAYEAWDGANPGGTSICPRFGPDANEHTVAQCDHYDQLAGRTAATA